MLVGHFPVFPSYDLFSTVFKAWHKLSSDAAPAELQLRALNRQPQNGHSAKFSETRYLADPEEISRWCSFQDLCSNNPRLHGCSLCFHHELVEVKFITGLWVQFTDDIKKDTHARFSLKAWISTLHWNNQLFNSGQGESEAIRKSRDSVARQTPSSDDQEKFTSLYGQMIAKAQEYCRPRMESQHSKKRSAVELLKRKIENQRKKSQIK